MLKNDPTPTAGLSKQAITSGKRRKRTDELEAGDIVNAYGMRLKLREMHSRELEAGTMDETTRNGLISEGLPPFVYWAKGEVLNMEDVREAGTVPVSWLTKDGETYLWTVQGNARAMWTVEAD